MILRSVPLILTVALGIAGALGASSAQQPGKVYRIGVLCPTRCAPDHPYFVAFHQGLRDFGWVEGQNIVMEYRNALEQADRLPGLAAELVNLKVDVIVAPSQGAAEVLKKATQTIPVVFAGIGDAVQTGLVASLARPGRNVTGLTALAGEELDAKRLEFLAQAVPNLSRVAILWTPDEPYNHRALKVLATAAQSLQLKLQPVEARGPGDFERAFSITKMEGTGAMLVLGSPMSHRYAARIAELAVTNRVPALFPTRESVDAGYLLSYGPNLPALYRRAAYYIDRILKGAKPADLPVEQPTKFELVVNLKTAKALGIEIPRSVLVRADEVIQ